MKNAPQVESENVIQVSFASKAKEAKIPHEIAHPASKRYPESLPQQEFEEDPLEALLNEGGGLDEAFEEELEEETYIHAHQKPFVHSASFTDSASELAASAVERLARLKEDAKRLRYYLDELNID